jgi:hypothetical protein
MFVFTQLIIISSIDEKLTCPICVFLELPDGIFLLLLLPPPPPPPPPPIIIIIVIIIINYLF